MHVVHDAGCSRVWRCASTDPDVQQWPEVMTTGYAAGLVTSLSSPTVIQARAAGRNYTLQVPPAKVLVGCVPCAAAQERMCPLPRRRIFVYETKECMCPHPRTRILVYERTCVYSACGALVSPRPVPAIARTVLLACAILAHSGTPLPLAQPALDSQHLVQWWPWWHPCGRVVFLWRASCCGTLAGTRHGTGTLLAR